MAVALDFGGSPVSPGELQGALEDYTVAQSTEFDVEHDHQGRHTKSLQSLQVSGLAQLAGLALGGLLELVEDYSVELSADVHDLTRPDGSPIQDVVIRLQTIGAVEITGLVPYDATKRQVHLIENGGNNAVRLAHNDSNSTYRFSLPGSTDLDLESGGVILIQWDIHSEVWRCLQAGSLPTVQRTTLSFTTGGPDIKDVTISAVEFATAQVRINGWETDAGGVVGNTAFDARVFLNSTTTVRAVRGSGFNNYTATGSIEVTGRLI